MKNVSLSTKLIDCKLVSEKYNQYLQHIGINSVSDLLNYYPHRYIDYSQKREIENIIPDQSFHFIGQIQQINSRISSYGKTNITTATVKDRTGFIKIIWFNNRYISKYLKKGKDYIFLATAKIDNYGLSLINPIFFPIENKPENLIIPVYSETRIIKSKWFISKIAKIIHLSKNISDFLPANIISENNLITQQQAILRIHQPQNQDDIKQATHRLAFNEIFILQLKNFFLSSLLDQNKAYSVKQNIPFTKKILSKLPYQLTNYQKKALWEIIQDLSEPKPTNRLLEGDVGSGKTIVALISCLLTASQNFQSILIAPTEILAIQHFQKAIEYFANQNITFCLFTGSKNSYNKCEKIFNSNRSKIIKKIEKNQIQIIIATHAIWHHPIKFDKLALTIIDEQHRFGVEQRNLLNTQAKTKPHIITMSATPIPRTLALSVYGHLKISQIKCRPAGRKPIITKIIHPNYRTKTYEFVKQQLSAGCQAFVICPLIEESDKMNLKSVITEFKNLSQEFSDFKVELLHGSLKDKIKDEIMQQFSQNKINLLVATSVIEVGIDIPNANIIIIEGSERFGLAQLHQFRGRVGRGEQQSYCFLFTNLPNEKVLNRLRVLTETNDGFKIAEADLKLRGPGELSGFKQSGLPDLRMASLSDQKLIKHSLVAVKKILSSDPDLSNNPLLKNIITENNTNLS